ncbi:MAG: ABC transporter permease subunit [Acidimicrobiia bacterium]
MADATPTSTDPATPEDPAPNGKKGRGWRRSLYIIIAILVAFVIYAFAFAKTDVSLEEIQSETRQEQLFRILRALARPDLVTYDKTDLVVTADVYVPCNGAEPTPVTPAETGETIVVTPTCAEAGDLFTVNGSGYEPGAKVSVNFVPVSDFDIVLPQGRVEAEEDGTFTVSFEAPSRKTDDPQQVEAITQSNVGGWRNRVTVWTDTNKNGVQDGESLPDSGESIAAYTSVLPEFDIRSPGGVTLVDDNNNVIDFISWGGSFEASTGSGTGLVSRDIGLDPFDAGPDGSVQLTGSGTTAEDFTWSGPSASSLGTINAGQSTPAGDSPATLFFNEVAFDDVQQLEIAGPANASVADVSMIFFDGVDGTQYKIVQVADKTDLSPRLSDNAINTWDRIVETVMLALLATTVGTMLAVPLSFLAAKNLMRDVTVPVINLSLSLIAIPIGLMVGIQASRWASSLRAFTDANWFTLLVALVVLVAIMWLLLRWVFPPEEEDEPPTLALRALRVAGLIGVAFLLLISSYIIGNLLILLGGWMEDLISFARFLGSFVVSLGEITEIAIPVFSSLIGAFALAVAASKLGYFFVRHASRPVVNMATLAVSAIAGALVGITIGAIIDWFYQLENPFATVVVPAAIGAVFGAFLSVKALRKAEDQNIGLTVYYMARTLFNGLRSIEPLVMVIIFVVWVGIGPFAGALALALHTTAALAKLYSEQVESIATGPLEAVRATGATRLQTIIYAVVPQIVPPYISFTMYRWDINVRMSTIIGFAGGGGIGFLLQQNINLLQYRAAAAQMLAIAIVVASMDYISSRLREKFV